MKLFVEHFFFRLVCFDLFEKLFLPLLSLFVVAACKRLWTRWSVGWCQHVGAIHSLKSVSLRWKRVLPSTYSWCRWLFQQRSSRILCWSLRLLKKLRCSFCCFLFLLGIVTTDLLTFVTSALNCVTKFSVLAYIRCSSYPRNFLLFSWLVLSDHFMHFRLLQIWFLFCFTFILLPWIWLLSSKWWVLRQSSSQIRWTLRWFVVNFIS